MRYLSSKTTPQWGQTLILCLFSIFLLCMTGCSSVNQSKEDYNLNFIHLVNEQIIPQEKFDSSSSTLGEYRASLRSFNCSSTYMKAILYFWQHEREIVELQWWKSTFPEERIIILSLYYGLQGKSLEARSINTFLPFEVYIKRFAEDEQLARENELNFVKSNMTKIREKIHLVVSPGSSTI